MARCLGMFEQMRTKRFLLLLVCIVTTSIIVFLYGDPKPTFHDFVSQTHRKFSELKLKVPVVVPEQKEPGADEQYLKNLGFIESPRLYPTHIWKNITLPAVATAVTSGQANLALGFIKSLQAHLAEQALIIYDLGLDSDELILLSKHCNSTNCTLRKFDYDLYPSHIGSSKFSAHRPIIIQEVLDQVGAVLWLDIQYHVVSSNIHPLLERAQKEGLLSWAIDQPTSSLTHPKMFDYFHTKQNNHYFHRMVQPSTIILYNYDYIHQKLMLPWVQCALTLECIAPIGAQSSGCRFDKKPLYRYSGCHRYDMSALNVILGKMFQYKINSYVASDKEVFFHLIQEESVVAKKNGTYSADLSANES